MIIAFDIAISYHQKCKMSILLTGMIKNTPDLMELCIALFNFAKLWYN